MVGPRRELKRELIEEKQESRPDKTFCEFFAGIGLVRLGLTSSNWKCIYANDISEKKRDLYELNFTGAEDFHLGDVWDSDAVLSSIPSKPFLATASFPCIDLSLAGHGRGFEGEHSSAFFGFSKVIEEMGANRPSVIMLENVAGFLTSKEGSDFESAVRCLADLGYWMDVFVLDAKYFVPQSRPRVFVIGVHESYVTQSAETDILTHASINRWTRKVKSGSKSIRPLSLIRLVESISLSTGWIAFDIPEPVVNRSPLSSLIDLDEHQVWWEEPAVTKHHNSMHTRHREVIDRMIADKESFVGTIYRRKREGTTRAEVRFDGVAGCLRTPKGGSAKQIVIHVHEGRLRMRWMSAREYARLQGANDFLLVENNIQNLYGFGDAVCVPVVQWIDRWILTPLFENTLWSATSVSASSVAVERPVALRQKQLF